MPRANPREWGINACQGCGKAFKSEYIRSYCTPECAAGSIRICECDSPMDNGDGECFRCSRDLVPA